MPTLTSPVVRRARATVLLLEHAERIGLPLPFSVEATDYTADVRLVFNTLADLTDWALWMEQPVTDYLVGDRLHHTVDGTALDQRVHLAAVLPATAGASS